MGKHKICKKIEICTGYKKPDIADRDLCDCIGVCPEKLNSNKGCSECIKKDVCVVIQSEQHRNYYNFITKHGIVYCVDFIKSILEHLSMYCKCYEHKE